MGVCTKRIDSYGDSCDRDCHFVESFMTPLTRPKLHPCAPPPRSTPHPPRIVAFRILSSRVLDVTFTSFVCVLTFSTVSGSLGSVRYGYGVASPARRYVAISVDGLPRSFSALRVFSTRLVYDLVNARKGRT